MTMKSSGFSDERFGNAPPQQSQNLTPATLPYFARFAQQGPQAVGGLPGLGEPRPLPLDDRRRGLLRELDVLQFPQDELDLADFLLQLALEPLRVVRAVSRKTQAHGGLADDHHGLWHSFGELAIQLEPGEGGQVASSHRLG